MVAEAVSVCSTSDAGGASVELLDVRRAFTVYALRRSSRLLSLPRVVRKSFAAVKGVTVSFRSGQVFALLGHNGAGKTTTFSLVAAQMEPTGGDVNVHGLSVRVDAPAVRKHLGICPQHDILYPELTAREHLELYGRLTGMTAEEVTHCVPGLLQQVRLHGELADKPSGHFSGGMQRRLSVACAFIGNPVGSAKGDRKVVMLDEPTTGMDPMNRKHVWDLVRDAKRDCTVVLTTHSMEEADALGDRIGILSSGQLVALGSSLHLKTKYGEVRARVSHFTFSTCQYN